MQKRFKLEEQPLMQTLLELFQQEEELFYNLVVVGVGSNAPPTMQKLEELAKRLRAVRLGCHVEEVASRKGRIVVGIPHDVIEFDGIAVEEVREMCQKLRFTGTLDPSTSKAARKYRDPDLVVA